jgi:integrase
MSISQISIFPDRRGYRVQWTEGGKRRSRNKPSEEEAQRFAAELRLGLAGLEEREGSPLFSDYAERWLKDYCQVEKAESQHKLDRLNIDRHLVPALGNLRLSQLRKSHLVTLKSELARKPKRTSKKGGGDGKTLSPKSVNNILALAKKMLATAVDLDLVPANPFQGVRPLKLPERTFDYWTPGERDEFLAKAGPLDPEFTRLVLVACHTGLRLGELAGLRRADLDFERGKINVGRAFNVNLSKITPTKNKGIAEVPMNSAVKAALADLLRSSEGAQVFPTRLFWSARNRLGSLATKVGSRPIRFHDLRHTFASGLAMAGTDLMQIQQLCRHRSYQMTLRYAHLHPEHLKGATEVLCTDSARKLREVRKSGGPRGT